MDMFKQRYGKLLESILIFLTFGVITFFFATTDTGLNYDTIWCFHMSQKVADGYLMYSEISTVVTPIFFWVGGLFVKLFGNNLISMHIYTGAIWGLLSLLMYKLFKITADKQEKFIFICMTMLMFRLRFYVFSWGI